MLPKPTDDLESFLKCRDSSTLVGGFSVERFIEVIETDAVWDERGTGCQ